MRTTACLIGLLLLAGCDEDTTPGDAGTNMDAGSSTDAGSSGDDAGNASDGGGTDDGGAGDDAAPGDGGNAGACDFFDGLERGCGTDMNCGVVTHQVDCCGTEIARGVNHAEVTRFGMLEPACRASYPACGCAAQPTMTDSGEVVTDPGSVQVACVAQGPENVCMTYVTMRPMDVP